MFGANTKTVEPPPAVDDVQATLATIGRLFALDQRGPMVEFLQARGWHVEKFTGGLGHPGRGVRARTEVVCPLAALGIEARHILHAELWNERPEKIG